MLTLALSSCTYTAKIKPPELPTPLVESIPARVGVYYPPELIDHEKVISLLSHDPQGEKILFNLGPPSIEVFDQAFAYSFDDVRRVNSRPPYSTDTPDLDAVVEVRLIRFAPRHDEWNDYTVSVTYAVTLWGLDGSQLGTWQSTQSSELHLDAKGVAVRVVPRHGSDYGKAAADSIGEIAADFLRSFARQPGVQAWIESLERPEENISRE
jgi:hypothetical protein